MGFLETVNAKPLWHPLATGENELVASAGPDPCDFDLVPAARQAVHRDRAISTLDIDLNVLALGRP